MNRVITCAVIALLCSGCAATDHSRSPDPFDPEAVPQISLRELARVGGHDSRREYTLAGVDYAALLDDGSVAIADGINRQEVRIFSEEGVFLRALGRSGGGPGEFRSIRGLVAVPGEIVVWDIQTLRLTYFLADGQLENTVTLNVDGLQQFRPSFVGVLSDGSAVFSDSRGVDNGIGRDTIHFVRFTIDGGAWREIASVVGPEKYNGSLAVESFIFGGEVRSSVFGDHLTIGTTDSLALTVYSSQGELLRQPKLSRPRMPVTERHVRLEKERRIRQYDPPAVVINTGDGVLDGVAENEARINDLPSRESLPAFSEFLPAGADGFWVREYLYPAENVQRWFRLTGDLEPTGWFDLSVGDVLLAANEDTIVVLTTDALDVETVVILRASDAAPLRGRDPRIEIR